MRTRSAAKDPFSYTPVPKTPTFVWVCLGLVPVILGGLGYLIFRLQPKIPLQAVHASLRPVDRQNISNDVSFAAMQPKADPAPPKPVLPTKPAGKQKSSSNPTSGHSHSPSSVASSLVEAPATPTTTNPPPLNIPEPPKTPKPSARSKPIPQKEQTAAERELDELLNEAIKKSP